MTSSQADWSVRANYWRGERALGGRLRVSGGVLAFEPHGFDRALGGDTPFGCALSDVVRLARAPRSFRFPRRRLIISTRAGDQAFVLVPRLNRVIRRLTEAIEAQGGRPEVDLEPTGTITPPEERPDNSLAMSLIHSGWAHLASVFVWLIFLAGVLAGSRNDVALTVLGVLILFSVWRAWAGFRRRARLRALLSEPPPESA